MDEAEVRGWVERYVRAWASNDPEDVGELFTDDARYFTAPHRDPWEGRDAIVAGWLGRRDEPGTWDFRFDVLGVAGGVEFVRGWTSYRDDPDYSNLWVIRLFPDGRCAEFTEWWMEVEKSAGSGG